jgi:hypothetical protein
MPHYLQNKQCGGRSVSPDEFSDTLSRRTRLSLSFKICTSWQQYTHHCHMASRASMVEGGPSILMRIQTLSREGLTLSGASISAPAASNTVTTATWPREQALWRAVHPYYRDETLSSRRHSSIRREVRPYLEFQHLHQLPAIQSPLRHGLWQQQGGGLDVPPDECSDTLSRRAHLILSFNLCTSCQQHSHDFYMASRTSKAEGGPFLLTKVQSLSREGLA